MATTVQAVSQPLSEPTSSVATTRAARTTTESSVPPIPRRSDSENGVRRPSGSSSKHSKRHTNQPILVWLQRKIGGGNKHALKKQQIDGLVNATNTPNGIANDSGSRGPSVDSTVRTSRKHATNGPNGNEPGARSAHSPSAKSDSLRPDSAWGMEPEADDDASIRPLPPTSPPSPVPSRMTQDSERTSGGYTSDLRSSRSAGTPSTKPTTLMSIELGAGGHIAQVPSISSSIQPQRGQQFASPPTPTSGSPVSTRFPNTRGSVPGAASVSFSPLLANNSRSNTGSSSVASTVPAAVNNLLSETTQTAPATVVVPASPVPKLAIHIPGHSQFHPRNNPRPASPPPDNASTLTLASSTFAVSHASPQARSMAADRERDFDAAASMRALRPSSRRGSWGSDETGWSGAALSTQTGVSSAGPMLLGFGGGPGSTMAGGYRRRGAGSIATARSAWSYRAGGKDSTGDGLDNVTNDDECEEEDGGSVDGDGDPRMTADELTPTEEVLIDFATTSPTSITRQSIILPHEIPLPASPDVTPIEIA